MSDTARGKAKQAVDALDPVIAALSNVAEGGDLEADYIVLLVGVPENGGTTKVTLPIAVASENDRPSERDIMATTAMALATHFVSMVRKSGLTRANAKESIDMAWDGLSDGGPPQSRERHSTRPTRSRGQRR